jgi:phosphatidylglycerophosphate synthase
LTGHGWMAGVACGVVMAFLVGRGISAFGVTRLGPADWVTLTRVVLAGGVAALAADSTAPPGSVTALVALAVVALSLDAVDGQVARRTGTVSEFGARFDGEVDAFLILVLSVYVSRSAGAWVLMIGAARYALLVAGWAVPWLRRTVPHRYWRKVVAAIQGIALTIAAASLLPLALTIVLLMGALALLMESFGRDVVWLWRRRALDPVAGRTFTTASTAMPAVRAG